MAFYCEWYTAPKTLPKTTTKKDLRKNNAMAMDIILHGLFDPMKEKFGKCTLAKEIQDKLQNLYTKGYLHKEHEDNQNERSCYHPVICPMVAVGE